MDAAAELGRNPVSKHQIQPEYGDEQADAGRTAEPVSRDQILRHARGQGNLHFPGSADHEQDWQPYPVDPYSAICDDHTYIHTYIQLYNRCSRFLLAAGGGRWGQEGFKKKLARRVRTTDLRRGVLMGHRSILPLVRCVMRRRFRRRDQKRVLFNFVLFCF